MVGKKKVLESTKKVTKEPIKNVTDNSEGWSKSKKKRMRKILAREKWKAAGGISDEKLKQTSEPDKRRSNPERVKKLDISKKKLKNKKSLLNESSKNTLIESFKSRLSGSRFRELNELLYTTDSKTALEKFSSEPDLFEQYHEGFRNQIQSWPVNPVDVISKWLLRFQKSRKRQVIVADFGCGDANLAKELISHNDENNTKFEVHSFDLVAPSNENSQLVTPCDMANVPLDSDSVHVAIFCLALMGTNIADFIREAHRVLQKDGILKIAEVRSRFESTEYGRKSENNTSLLEEFKTVMGKLGFELKAFDNKSNKLFFLMEFRKIGIVPDSTVTFTAKACIYKRR